MSVIHWKGESVQIIYDSYSNSKKSIDLAFECLFVCLMLTVYIIYLLDVCTSLICSHIIGVFNSEFAEFALCPICFPSFYCYSLLCSDVHSHCNCPMNNFIVTFFHTNY